MSWPKTFSRKTNHAKPRCQLYQPGFNEHNGCWLEGSWITLPEAAWKKRKATHEKMCKDITKLRRDQTHHNDGVGREDMTKAQRQAWEHYSGTGHFDVVYSNGNTGPVGVDMAGNKLQPSSEKWLREHKGLILKWTFGNGKRRPPTNQLKGLDIPKDLVSTEHGATKKTAVDTHQNVVDQNVERFDQMFYECADALEKNDEPAQNLQFAAMMAFNRIIEVEEGIIRMEWNVSKGEQADEFQTLEGETKRYVKIRKRLKEALKAGAYDEPFDELYLDYRKSHNECARANLDNSDGNLFCYVLPVFKDDGTHEPWGERDVPWNATDPWAYDDDEGAAAE